MNLLYNTIAISLLPDALGEICNVLESVKSKWLLIGVQFGIPEHKLEEFRQQSNPLVAVISYCLKGNVEDKLFSWQFIAKALKSPQVDEKGLAKTVSQKYENEGELLR